MVPKGPVEVFGVDIYCLQPALPSSSDPDVAKEGIFFLVHISTWTEIQDRQIPGASASQESFSKLLPMGLLKPFRSLYKMHNTKENQPEVANRLGVMLYCSFKREQRPSTRIY